MKDLRHAIELWLLRRRLLDLAELVGGTVRAVPIGGGDPGWSVAFSASVPGVVDRTVSASADDLRTALWFLGLSIDIVPRTPLTGWRRLLAWCLHRPRKVG